MLSDEEKKAIDVIKSLGISIYNGKSQIIPGDTTKEISTAIYTTINLIESQQKEIEELKRYEEGYKLLSNSLNNYINKDKIKAIIEELENDPNNIEEHNCLRADTCYVINILQSLLGKE